MESKSSSELNMRVLRNESKGNFKLFHFDHNYIEGQCPTSERMGRKEVKRRLRKRVTRNHEKIPERGKGQLNLRIKRKEDS